jgi:hypothetical protein
VTGVQTERMSYPNRCSPRHDKDHHGLWRAFRLTVTTGAALPMFFMRQKRALAVAAGVASMAMAAVACGGPGGPAASSPVSDTLQHILAYTQCMQSHGDPSFPDPAKNPFGGYWFADKPTMSGPVFSTAQKACKKLQVNLDLSAGEQHTAANQLLRFATCMRAHGVPNFPDPNVGASGAGFAIPNGTDVHSQQWQSGQRACQSYLRGPRPAAGG